MWSRQIRFACYSGLVRLHVFYYATREPVFGFGMIAELNRNGYKLGPGTMYPLLHGMEKGAGSSLLSKM